MNSQRDQQKPPPPPPPPQHDQRQSLRRMTISTGSTWEREVGYSRAVVVGDQIFVSGTTGFDYTTMTIAEDDIIAQTAQCIQNIRTTLRQAGADLCDVVRILYIVPNPDEFEAAWPVLREAFGGEGAPAATMFAARLADSRMKIEIEVTAIRRSGL